MKRILLSLAIIAVVASASVGATKAYFNDSVALTGVTISSGNANLKINNLGSSGWIDALTLDYQTQWATRYDAGGWYRDYYTLEKPIMWYPGLERGDGFYLGNFSLSRIGLNPTISVPSYSETVPGMGDVFLLQVGGSGYQTLTWWRTHSYALPTIAWCAAPQWDTCGTQGVSMSLKMDTGADNTKANGLMTFDLRVDAEQVH
jgi:hypothetical protein